eukprot:PhM_4_TR18684/c3_g3_i2/m.46378
MKTTLCRHHQIHVETQQALAEGRKPKPINRRHGGSTIAAQIKIREQGCPKGMYCPSAHGEHELNTPVLVAPSTTTTTTTQTATTSSSKPMNRRTVIVKATSGPPSLQLVCLRYDNAQYLWTHHPHAMHSAVVVARATLRDV